MAEEPRPVNRTRPGPRRATLLVFTLDAAAERARRRLLPPALGGWESAIYRDCLAAALDAGRAAGCALRVCTPRRGEHDADVVQLPQPGRGFADRFRRAVARFRPSSSRPLVVVGSDTPGLTREHVAGALARLTERSDRLVVGPAPDGGFYLLAAARPVDELLRQVRWLRGDTLASLLAAARAHDIEISLLAPLSDLDDAGDLERWLARGAARAASWSRHLLALLGRRRRPMAVSRLGRPALGSPLLVPVRGPPRRRA